MQSHWKEPSPLGEAQRQGLMAPADAASGGVGFIESAQQYVQNVQAQAQIQAQAQQPGFFSSTKGKIALGVGVFAAITGGYYLYSRMTGPSVGPEGDVEYEPDDAEQLVAELVVDDEDDEESEE